MEFTRGSILIVDDNARIRALLHEWLAAEFPERGILEAASGEEAVDCSGTVPVSLAVMDIGLPGMNGIDAARILMSRHPELKVVILSIHDEERYRCEAGAAGVHAYVPKRKLQEQLLPVIREQLNCVKLVSIAAVNKS